MRRLTGSLPRGVPSSLALTLLVVCLVLACAVTAGAGTIVGRTVDANTGAAVPWVEVELVGTSVAAISDLEGRFAFPGLEPGSYTVRTRRLGYDPASSDVEVMVGEIHPIDFDLVPQAVQMEAREVSGSRIEHERDLYEGQAPVVVAGQELRERMASTVSGVLADHAGVTQESMGPSPARPVVRGLSGNRLLVLEDEANTGDLSGSSPDHALVSDPLNATRIEVLRGPATLLYGSSVLGGVVNVRREAVPLDHYERARGSVQFIGDSVNHGSAGHANLIGPLGPLSYSFDFVGRTAGDVSTPIGDMRNTQIDTWNGSVGLGWLTERAHLGVAASLYESDYGIPGGFLGGHPNGVDIELERKRVQLRGGIHFERGPVDRWEAHGVYTRYFHQEIESTGICGVSFGLLNYGINQRLHFDRGPWGSPVLALSLQHRDYAQGCLSFVPPTVERTWAAAAYNELHSGPVRWVAGVRAEFREVDVSREVSNKAGDVRDRSFSGVGASIAASMDLRGGLGATATLTRAFRSPALEELFSEGPHLAAYSYEIGNADLGVETGRSAELRLDWQHRQLHAAITGFWTDFANYIHPVDTGELEFGPGAEGFLQRWQYRGRDARLVGGELDLQWRPWNRLELSAVASTVNGTDREIDQPLPRIPPVQGRLAARLRTGTFTWGMNLRAAADQRELSEFEEPTAGWAELGASVQWSRLTQNRHQSILLRVNNLTDGEVRNHLSRIRSILPEPGRNVTLLYRVGFF